jgi:phosphohistidine phosphatase
MANLDLYLIRHGLAAERGTFAEDGDRPLTEAGQQKTQQVAKHLRALDLKFNFLLTSPLVRAHQTAAILVAAGLAPQLSIVDYLAPGGNLSDWLTWLRTVDVSCVALVGHEPDLSTWAERLLWGESHGVLTLKKAGVIGLSLPGDRDPLGRSTLFWLTPPRFLLE